MSRARDTANQINRLNSSAADATALTVDSSERVLIGKTSAGYNVDGFEAHPNGETYVSRSGTPMAINRNSSDGTLLNLYKDGATVGSIGVYSSDNLYLQGKSDHSGLAFGEAEIYGFRGGSENDGVTSLGSAAGRWKDAYLSGGIYLGGTGSANKLDDYETGTWTPTAGRSSSDPTASYSERLGSYVKIGDLVHASFDINISSISGGSGTIRIKGLPFTVSSSTNNFSGYGVAHWRSTGAVPAGAAGTQLKGYTERGESYIHVQYDNSGTSGFSSQGNTSTWQTGRATGYVIYPAQS